MTLLNTLANLGQFQIEFITFLHFYLESESVHDGCDHIAFAFNFCPLRDILVSTSYDKLSQANKIYLFPLTLLTLIFSAYPKVFIAILQAFQYGLYQVLLPPDFKECCIILIKSTGTLEKY